MRSLYLIGALLMLATSAAAQEQQIKGVRIWPAPDNTRLVFDLSGPVHHKLFILENPERVVIDIADARLATQVDEGYSSNQLKGIRFGVRKGTDLRVVLDLKKKIRPKSFFLRPSEQYGDRLVIDLEDADGAAKPVRSMAELGKPRDLVIAIDAGHGGEDPGATGPHGIHEKDVVLAIARRLENLVNKRPGMRAVMTRDGDYYVALGKRVEIAREDHADLFVSIHADAFRNRNARGTSVYVLSRSGASSEHARLLAAKENEADLVGGVSLEDKDDLLASVLLDLSQTATNEASYRVAKDILARLDNINVLHRSRVERAGFRVLKAPDIPSLLVETAFITNPHEERELNDARHQQKIATALMNGIDSYFNDNPPPGTVLAAHQRRQHEVTSGETLSSLARRYQVSQDSLQSYNGLTGTSLQVGDVLKIPAPNGS